MTTLVQTVARMKPEVLRASVAALRTPQTQELLRSALAAEVVAAHAMSDEVFWGYDRAWYTQADRAILIDVKQAGMCGGGGCNESFNNNQFWSLSEACTRSLFALVIFQQRRYMAAQLRLRRLLENAPQPEIIAGFDRFASNTSQGLRAACGGQHMREKGREWAYWCEEVLRVVGAARWASNFTWSDTPETCADFSGRSLAAVGGRAIGGPASGCGYPPDCSSDPFGVPRLGYVRGASVRGLLRWKALYDEIVARQYAKYGVPQRGQRPFPFIDFDSTRGTGLDPYAISIAPQVLGLRRSDRDTAALDQRIPADVGDFSPRLVPAAKPGLFGPFQQPQVNDLGSTLLAAFIEVPDILERDGVAWQTVLAEREQIGWWYITSRQNIHAWMGSEMFLWWIVALAREVVDTSYGQVMIDGFTNLDLALQRIPPEWRTGDFAGALQAIHRVANELAAARQEMVMQVIGGASAVVTAVVPILGVVMAAIGAAAGLLVRFSLDLGVTRRENPPVIQYPALRVAAIGEDGEDRCAINPNAQETLTQYQERVTSTYAEAARRTGGEAGAMFDEIERIRTERYCLQYPGDPRCLPATTFPWTKVAAVAGGAAGFALVRVLLGG